MIAAKVVNGEVVQTAIIETEGWAKVHLPGWIVCRDDNCPGIGWKYNGEFFYDPTPPVETPINSRLRYPPEVDDAEKE